MKTLLYTIIKSDAQYRKYCDRVEELVKMEGNLLAIREEIDLLNLLIDKYDEEHNTFQDADPIQLLKALMKEQKMKAVNLAELLQVSKGLVSDILQYKKGLSKETIRILAGRFKLSQDAFNRPYKLKTFSKIALESERPAVRKRKEMVAEKPF